MEPEEVLEQEVEQQVDTEVEQSSEQPTEEVVETPSEPVIEPENSVENVQEPTAEGMTLNTNGRWEDLERITDKSFEVGKTYKIKVSGYCQFMISAEKPTFGMETNEIIFTKQEGLKLWIKTGIKKE